MATYKITTKNKTPIYTEPSTTSKIKKYWNKGETKELTNLKYGATGYVWGVTNGGAYVLISDGKKSYVKNMKTLSYKNGTGELEEKKVSVSTLTSYNDIYKALTENTNDGHKLKRTMQLFGLPYQFLPSVDCRIDDINSSIGRKFIQNIILDAPVITILPGKADYLPGKSDDAKVSWTNAFIKAANGDMGDLKAVSSEDSKGKTKFYDFKTDYMEYMRYVNILCRTCATLLELDKEEYIINGKKANFLHYDWKDYRWNGEPYQSTTKQVFTAGAKAAKSIFEKTVSAGSEFVGNAWGFITGDSKKSKKKEIDITDSTDKMTDEEKDTLEDLFRNVHFVQFYVDPESSSVSESISNTSQPSSIKGMLDSATSAVREVAFMANSGGGAETLQKLQSMGTNMLDSLAQTLNENGGESEVKGILARILSVGSNIVSGEAVSMPDIYSGSSYTKSYQFTVHLKAIYGDKYSYYMDVLVPLMHLLALGLPKGTSANTFNSPFLVKAYMGSVFVCNLGLVTDISINKMSTTESWNVDGLCTEMDVTLGIADLYSDLAMTPSNDPVMFVNNTSLVEYLAISCGLNLIESQFTTKMSLLLGNIESAIFDISDNVIGGITENIDDWIYSWTDL